MTDEVVSFDRKKIDDMATLATGALGNPVSRMMMMRMTADDEVINMISLGHIILLRASFFFFFFP